MSWHCLLYTSLELARKHNLRVIEDAAQAFGATYRGMQAGTLGDFGTISFFPTKNLGALGDAGALLTNDTAVSYTHLDVYKRQVLGLSWVAASEFESLASLVPAAMED